MSGLNNPAIDTAKIDRQTTDGLTGTNNSLAYRVAEIESHLHHYSRAFGLAAVPDAELHRADEITSDPAPFVVDAGNDTWGTALQIFGSDDTPAGWVKFDPHLISIVGAETANVTYLIQLIAGSSAAAGISAGTYSDKVFRPQSANGRPAPIPINIKRQSSGTKIWIRTLARGQNTATISFYLESHGYSG